MAIALYRRYRPETFAEMIGQAQVTEPLMTALRSGSVGHAYLFSGPRGCGKTTSARVLARCLNCAQGPTDTPCGVCQSCIDLSRDGGGSLDVIEIDAASHGGVDDARDLRERAIFAPVRDRYKIFIIDEAHMVSPSGFNALLKIVEEPPEHVKFVFATTEPEKVIGTIRSRTHHYPFRLIAPAPLMEYVHQLCEEEGVTIEDGVLPLVIRAGGGSARDTLSILDQLIAGSEQANLTYERAVGLLGYTHEDLLDEIVTAVAEADAAAGVEQVDRVIQSGQDPRRFVEDLLERLRDLIIVRAVDVEGAMAVLRGTPEDQVQRLFEQASRFDASTLSHVADLVRDTLDSMTGATAPRLHLELMMARIFVAIRAGTTAPATVAPPATTPSQQETSTPSAPAASPTQTPAPQALKEPAPTPRPAPQQPEVQQPAAHVSTPAAAGAQAQNTAAILRDARAMLAGGTPEPSRTPTDPAPATTPAHSGHQEQDVSLTTAEVQRVWPELVTQLQHTNPAAANVAQETLVIGMDGTQLTLGFTNTDLLEAFKTQCATPVRELLEQRYRVRVGYLPRVGQARIREAQQLHGASSTVATAAETLVPTREPTTASPPVAEREQPPNPPTQPGPPPQAASVVDREPPPEPEETPPEPEPNPGPHSSATAHRTPDTAAEASAAPEYVRYGESVVREMLGATFVEEQPLPGHSDTPTTQA